MNKEPKPESIPGDLIQDYAELGVDALVDGAKPFMPMLEQVSSDFPIVKTLTAVVKLPRTVSDFLLGRKVNAFLFSSGLDAGKIEKFKGKFSRTKQERLWESVVFSINAHDDKKKSEIVGKLFQALVNEEISEEEFFDMVHATNSLNLNNLESLKQLYMLTDARISQSLVYSFVTLRLVEIENSVIGAWDSQGPAYPLNQTGWKYVGIIYDYPASGLPGVKIGFDDLIGELDKDGRATNKAFPLEVLKQRGSRYIEVDIFQVDEEKRIVCSSANNRPHLLTSVIVKAGEVPYMVAQNVIQEQGLLSTGPLISVLQRNMEESSIQKFAFVIKNDDLPEGTYSDTSVHARELMAAQEKTDQFRYEHTFLEALEKVTDWG